MTRRTLIPALAIATLAPALIGATFEHVPRSAKQCIPRASIRSETAETHTHLIFHVGGGKAYRNYLPEPCEDLLHLNNVDKLQLHSADPDQLCAGDNVQLAPQKLIGALTGDDDGPAPTCRIGRFEPISEMSLTEEIRR